MFELRERKDSYFLFLRNRNLPLDAGGRSQTGDSSSLLAALQLGLVEALNGHQAAGTALSIHVAMHSRYLGCDKTALSLVKARHVIDLV